MDKDRYILVGDKMPDAIWGKNCWKDSIISKNENDKYYFISIGLFGLDDHIYGNRKTVIVMPETSEHKELTELIKLEDNHAIETYAQILAIKYLPSDYVYHMINKVKYEKYKHGCRDTQSRILEALGLKESKGDPYIMRQY